MYLPQSCFIALLLLSLVSRPCWGQDSIDYQMDKQLIQILLRDDTALDSIVDQMLTNSYLLRSAKAELLQKQEAWAQSKRSWLSTFIVGVSLYSQSTSFDETTQTSVTTSGVLPNLGVSLSINPEKLMNMRSNARIAQQDIVRSENAMNEQRRTLKIFIIGKYYEYLEALNVLEFRYNTHESQREMESQTQQKFERGEATYGEVLMAQNGLINAEEAVIRAEIFVKKLKQEITLYTTDSESSQP
uniref:TolC family protein n=1 Tax=Roseihalotalea indica TaxID=2867963 RepID=A0AA49GGX5_9BACT|nr:TolC family protein [Tunicatimonas sp. TK19036]